MIKSKWKKRLYEIMVIKTIRHTKELSPQLKILILKQHLSHEKDKNVHSSFVK
jgi:hypothetical protein